jgi:putative oxidoreductase
VRGPAKCPTLPRVTANDEEYGRSRQNNPFSDPGYYDSAPAQGTSVLSRDDELDFGDEPSTRWHGGLDFGLLIVRLALGGILGAHGLQKVFGTFHGPGAPEFARILADHGFTSQTTLLSWLGGIAEVAGSGLLILGLFTPAAAAMLVSVTATVVYLGYGNGFFLGTGDGFEYHLMLAATAFGLLFTGPGRLSLDVNTPWRRKPVPFAFLGVVLAGAAVTVVITLFR